MWYIYEMNERRFLILDSLLEIMSRDYTTQLVIPLSVVINELKQEKNIEIDSGELERHLIRMAKDGIVKNESEPIGFGNKTEIVSSKITAEGLDFIEEGGYRHRNLGKILAEQRVRISQTLQYILAVGVSTPFVWYLKELLKPYFPIRIDLKSSLILFFFGMCIGATILATIQELVKRKSK